jgi:hypothetical protein
MIINRIYETPNLLSLYLVSFLVGLRIYQHPCTNTVVVLARINVYWVTGPSYPLSVLSNIACVYYLKTVPSDRKVMSTPIYYK